MTLCRSCGLDGPCDYGGCPCEACGAGFTSRVAAERCADIDDRRSPFTD